MRYLGFVERIKYFEFPEFSEYITVFGGSAVYYVNNSIRFVVLENR